MTAPENDVGYEIAFRTIQIVHGGEAVMTIDLTLALSFIGLLVTVIYFGARLGAYRQRIDANEKDIATLNGKVDVLEDRHSGNVQSLEQVQTDTGWMRRQLVDVTTKLDKLNTLMARHLGSHDAETGQ